MEQVLSYLQEKKYKIIDITSSMNIITCARYTKSLINKPNVIAYFKITNDNNFLFNKKQKDHNYCFINKDNLLSIKITDEFDKVIESALSKLLEPESVIVTDSSPALCQKKTKFNLDEIKEYVSSKGRNFRNITSNVTKQNYHDYLTGFEKNDLLVITRNKNTEFIFTTRANHIAEEINNHNILMIGDEGSITFKCKNKLDFEHKLKIDIIIASDEIIDCDLCPVKKRNNINMCGKCGYKACIKCFKKVLSKNKKCPKCKHDTSEYHFINYG
jgi:hypothetical protein